MRSLPRASIQFCARIDALFGNLSSLYVELNETLARQISRILEAIDTSHNLEFTMLVLLKVVCRRRSIQYHIPIWLFTFFLATSSGASMAAYLVVLLGS